MKRARLRIRLIVLALELLLGLGAEAAPQLISSGPIAINGQSGTVIKGLRITSTSGNCVTVTNSSNITIEQSEIGPCGDNNSTNLSNAVQIIGSNHVYVYDNYLHVENLASRCCDTHDNLNIQGSSYVIVQGNVIAYGEANIEVNGSADDHITIAGNFLLNPRGPFPRGDNFQSWGPSATNPNTNISVNNNYTLSSTDTKAYLYAENQEDSINFGFTQGPVASDNYIAGGHSTSGCGLIADDGTQGALFSSNILSNTGGACGIGMADGRNHAVTGNKILNLVYETNAGPVAMYATKNYSTPCGPMFFANNIAATRAPNGWNSFHQPNQCSGVTATGNTLDEAAYNLLNPMARTNPPPPIPVRPKSCVAVSPYTTNTSLPACGIQ